MFKVIMVFGNEEYAYGTYSDRNKANEVAMQVRSQRNCDTYVEEVA